MLNWADEKTSNIFSPTMHEYKFMDTKYKLLFYEACWMHEAQSDKFR